MDSQGQSSLAVEDLYPEINRIRFIKKKFGRVTSEILCGNFLRGDVVHHLFCFSLDPHDDKNGLEFVSCSVQTEDILEDEFVQISTSLKDLLQRILSYQRYKRFQLDISNQVEFCHDATCGSSCARTGVTHFRRSTKVNQVKGQDKGPLGNPLLPLEQFQRSLHHEQTALWDRCAANSATSLLHLPQRLSDIEQYLGINQQGGSKPKDLLTRVALLEMQLLAVEGRSYEYIHSKVGNKSVPANEK